MWCRRTAWLVLLGIVGGVASAAAAGLPDLVESKVTLAQHGRTLRVSDTVVNRGGVTATGSRTAYYLAGRRIGSRTVPRLRPGATARSTRTLTVPSAVPPGSWPLRACADFRAQVRESNERNNCRAASRLVVVGDVTPPRFAGLARATTCVPGPVGGTTHYTPYHLEWQPATDNATPATGIVYDIYETQTAGGEDYSKPTYTTPPGATSFSTPPLPDNVPHYFVVRAVDKAGNEDANKVERPGMNLCV